MTVTVSRNQWGQSDLRLWLTESTDNAFTVFGVFALQQRSVDSYSRCTGKYMSKTLSSYQL